MNSTQWKAASAYTSGVRHRKENIPCQDRAVYVNDDDFRMIALSDGAGSCSLSHEGAECVTQVLKHRGSEWFDDWYDLDESDIAEAAQARLIEVLEAESLAREVLLKELSCTLLFVMIKDSRCLIGHVGDGVIAARKDGELFVLSHPENGRFLNETYFVTMTPLGKHFRIRKKQLTGPVDFMLMSDGTASSFYFQEKRTLEPRNTHTIFDFLVQQPQEEVPGELSALLELLKENTDDDCSISVLTSHAPEQIAVYSSGDPEEDQDDFSFEEPIQIPTVEHSEDRLPTLSSADEPDAGPPDDNLQHIPENALPLQGPISIHGEHGEREENKIQVQASSPARFMKHRYFCLLKKKGRRSSGSSSARHQRKTRRKKRSFNRRNSRSMKQKY